MSFRVSGLDLSVAPPIKVIREEIAFHRELKSLLWRLYLTHGKDVQSKYFEEFQFP